MCIGCPRKLKSRDNRKCMNRQNRECDKNSCYKQMSKVQSYIEPRKCKIWITDHIHMTDDSDRWVEKKNMKFETNTIFLF